MNFSIRLASLGDVPSMLEIYEPYVRETAISFEYDVPDLEVFRGRFHKFTRQCPWFVCESGEIIAGYAYAHPFHERAAYKWSVESSIYVDARHQGRNIGKALYTCLFDTLRLQGFCNAFAGVTIPNAKSESLHASFGFQRVGVLKNIGYKNGRWHDVACYTLPLADFMDNPRPPKAIWEVSDTAEFAAILQNAAALIKPV